MTEIEKSIQQTLVELEQRVKEMPTANPKPDLRPLFSRLDELEKQLPVGTAGELRHYLQRKSYEKAQLYLDGRDAENAPGSCGHK